MALQQRRTGITSVMAAVRTRLATVLDWEPSRIKQVVRAAGKVPAFDGDTDIVLRWAGWKGDGDHESRVDFRVYRRLEVILRVRSESDEADADEIWLAGQGGEGGADDLEQQVLDALVSFQPEEGPEGAVDDLTFEPMVPTQADYSRPPEDQGWGEITFAVDVGYQPALTVGDGSSPS